MSRINYTTRYSQINAIKNEIDVLNQKLNNLSRQFQTCTQMGFNELSDDIRNTIDTLSKNVDIMLNQMIEAQRQLTEANTITITRPLSLFDIELLTNNNQLTIRFKRQPSNIDGYVEIETDELQTPLIVFYDPIHHSTHSNCPNYKPQIVKNNEIKIMMKQHQTNPRITNTTFLTAYEFEQDELISYCVNQIDLQQPNFFGNILKNIKEIKK